LSGAWIRRSLTFYIDIESIYYRHRVNHRMAPIPHLGVAKNSSSNYRIHKKVVEMTNGSSDDVYELSDKRTYIHESHSCSCRSAGKMSSLVVKGKGYLCSALLVSRNWGVQYRTKVITQTVLDLRMALQNSQPSLCVIGVPNLPPRVPRRLPPSSTRSIRIQYYI
jgi:hypothetical protein